jgi:hypothetical protein
MMQMQGQPIKKQLPASSVPWALDGLPPFPLIATRLLVLLAQEDPDTAEVCRIISAEPVYAAKVLQLAKFAPIRSKGPGEDSFARDGAAGTSAHKVDHRDQGPGRLYRTSVKSTRPADLLAKQLGWSAACGKIGAGLQDGS